VTTAELKVKKEEKEKERLSLAGGAAFPFSLVLDPDWSFLEKALFGALLSRAREAMHVYTRDKAALRQSVMQLGERKSVWELVQITRKSKPQFRCAMKPDLRAARQMEIVREIGMER
jgi:hypothetical protein